MKKLKAKARAAALKGLTHWHEVKGRDAISRKFEFKDFNEAFGFMSRVALLAEKNRTIIRSGSTSDCDVTLSTHDAGGLTENDVKMAEAMKYTRRNDVRRRAGSQAAEMGLDLIAQLLRQIVRRIELRARHRNRPAPDRIFPNENRRSLAGAGCALAEAQLPCRSPQVRSFFPVAR